MMVMFRMVLAIVLVSSSVVMSMEKEHAQMSIQHVLDAIMKPRQEGQLNDVALVTLYFCTGGNINAKGTILTGKAGQKTSGMNLLMTSVCYDLPELAKFLINRCYARLDCVNEYGDTALHIAAHTGREYMVRILLASGANKNIQNNDKRTALDVTYNSPWRYHSFYNQKDNNKEYYFPRIIRFLERPDKEKKQYFNEIDNAQNCPQLLITHTK